MKEGRDTPGGGGGGGELERSRWYCGGVEARVGERPDRGGGGGGGGSTSIDGDTWPVDGVVAASATPGVGCGSSDEIAFVGRGGSGTCKGGTQSSPSSSSTSAMGGAGVRMGGGCWSAACAATRGDAGAGGRRSGAGDGSLCLVLASLLLFESSLSSAADAVALSPTTGGAGGGGNARCAPAGAGDGDLLRGTIFGGGGGGAEGSSSPSASSALAGVGLPRMPAVLSFSISSGAGPGLSVSPPSGPVRFGRDPLAMTMLELRTATVESDFNRPQLAVAGVAGVSTVAREDELVPSTAAPGLVVGVVLSADTSTGAVGRVRSGVLIGVCSGVRSGLSSGFAGEGVFSSRLRAGRGALLVLPLDTGEAPTLALVAGFSSPFGRDATRNPGPIKGFETPPENELDFSRVVRVVADDGVVLAVPELDFVYGFHCFASDFVGLRLRLLLAMWFMRLATTPPHDPGERRRSRLGGDRLRRPEGRRKASRALANESRTRDGGASGARCAGDDAFVLRD